MNVLTPPGVKVRYAVVGAGWFGQAAVITAFRNARENSMLAAIVSGDPGKRAELSKKYGVPAVGYDGYDALLSSGEIDAVYVVTPNSEHRQHVLAAANRGVHVLCEKPLADTAAAAEHMVEECEKSSVLLMTAYRLHFEVANLNAVELARSGKIGDPRLFNSVFTMKVEDEGNVRLKPGEGGPLLDIGIYCVNAARYLFRAEPTEVFAFSATGADPKFRGVPEMVSALLRFPGERLATFTCGFGGAKVSSYQLIGTSGNVRLDPAYSHAGERRLFLTVGNDDADETRHKEADQIAPEIVYFSNCLLTGERPEPDGREGLTDLRILEAIQRSLDSRAPVTLTPDTDVSRPTKDLLIEKGRVREPKLVNASSPTDQ